MGERSGFGHWHVLASVLVLLVTFLAWSLSRNQVDREIERSFHSAANRALHRIEDRLRLYSEVLVGLQGLYAVSKEVTRDDFAKYVAVHSIDTRYPGFQALSFDRLVRDEERESFEEEVRTDTSLRPAGYPDFSITPPGKRREYVVVELIEPMAGNEMVFGYDVASDPTRREALNRARDSGEPTATGPITLAQDVGEQSSFLLFNPVYGNQRPNKTVEQRREAFAGVLVAVFRMDDLISRAMLIEESNGLNLKIYDMGRSDSNRDEAEGPGAEIFDSAFGSPSDDDPATTLTFDMEVGGRRWSLSFQSRKLELSASTRSFPLLVLGGGAVLSLFVLITLKVTQARRLAAARARSLASDLCGSLDQLRIAATLFENTSEGLMITDSMACILTVNPAFTEITGYSEKDAVNQNPRMLRSEWHDDSFYKAMWTQLIATGQWQGEIWNRRKDGSLYAEWLSISTICNSAGETTHYVSLFRDITGEKRSRERLQYLAQHDSLTDLPNRVLLEDRLAHAALLAKRNNHGLAVLFIDIDHFKTINDSFGHHAGDKLLKQAAKRMKDCLRACDTIARLGGDEFVAVLMTARDRSKVDWVAQKIAEDLREEFFVDEHIFRISASIGVSLYPEDSLDCETLLRFADTAMYNAKQSGRNNYKFYEASMTETARDLPAVKYRQRNVPEVKPNKEPAATVRCSLPDPDARDERFFGGERK